MIQFGVVGNVDEELRRRAVAIVRASHRHGPPLVQQVALGLHADGLHRRLLVEFRRQSAALHDEAANHPMEHRIGVETVVDVLQKILDGLGRGLGIELDLDRPF